MFVSYRLSVFVSGFVRSGFIDSNQQESVEGDEKGAPRTRGLLCAISPLWMRSAKAAADIS